MSGETELSNLIKGLKPQLQAGEYVFCTLPDNQIPKDVQPIGIFREVEGTTLIISKQEADRLSIPYSFVAAWITLTIHSSLEAVGLTAAISLDEATCQISFTGFLEFVRHGAQTKANPPVPSDRFLEQKI